MAIALDPKSARDAGEQHAREQLAALYRLFVHYGWTDLIDTHISARVPGRDGEYLINAYGQMFDEITASSLIKVDYDGNVLDSDEPYNQAGHLIHTAILKARPEINFVAHSHTRAGIAVSAMKQGLLPLSQHAGSVLGTLSMHEYQVVTDAEDECDALARDIGDAYCMIMHNHGLLTCGRTASEAFMYHYTLEMACKVQVDVLQSGAEIIMPGEAAVEALKTWGDPRDEPTFGARHWQALMRRLDRTDPDYKS